MLAYLLALLSALVVGLASFGFYMAAFFFPEVYRRHDFLWSGVGAFYALMLWVNAERLTGGVLLGQIAGVALISWFGYQTLQLRYEQTPIAQRTPLPATANSAGEVMQFTVQQLRASFRKSADRSALAARLEHTLTRLETVWQTVRNRFTALLYTTLDLPPMPEPEPAASQKAEPYAEWDDLEIETFPEMETSDNPVAPLPSKRSIDALKMASRKTPPA